MQILLRIWAVFVVALKRLYAQRWLALATVLGLVASTALALSLPLYANAVYHRVLRTELWGRPDLDQGDLPLAFLFRYIGDWAESLPWQEVAPADGYLRGDGTDTLGLPTQLMVRHVRSAFFGVYTPLDGEGAYEITDTPLTSLRFGFMGDLASHITLLEGTFPAAAPADPAMPVEVLIHEEVALETGLQVGERYTAFTQDVIDGRLDSVEIPLRIAGVWRATDPEEPFWFYNPSHFADVMMVPEETFVGHIGQIVDDEVDQALWYLILDGSGVVSNEVGALVTRIRAVQTSADTRLPGIRLDLSPLDALWEYRRATSLLTILLYAFSVPIFGLILAFITLVAHLVTTQQRNEIAVLRSRGSTVPQVVAVAALEALLLAVVALAAGVPVGARVAHLMGRARSFLDFSMDTRLQVQPTMSTLTFGFAIAALALLVQVVPTIGAARHSIVTYKQQQARRLRPPWWQRMWLDVLLFIPALYGGYLLRRQGSLVTLGSGGNGDIFQNPLLFLVPALAAFSLSLFVLRLMPLIMQVVTWAGARSKAVGFLMAARHLARTPSFYTAPLILLVLTLSLSTFVASMAQTMDRHLYDQEYYQYGADLRLVEQGESTAEMMMGGGDTTDEEDGGPQWLFLPVSEHLKVPGVRAAARVGRYNATTSRQHNSQQATVIGVDRTDFPRVAFWRQDFGRSSLGSMMNALAGARNGVLVSRDFQGKYVFGAGDTLQVHVYAYGQRTDLDLEVVGFFDLFPTWYPTDVTAGPLFVVNLDYLFEAAGGQLPYNVWLETDAGVSYRGVVEGVEDLGLDVRSWDAPLLEVVDEQQRPERQGLFGALSVGFAAAAVLTALGFLLYAFFSFRRRFVELGVLRAIGLSPRQMTAFLAWELGFLVAIGLGAGTGLGVGLTNFFVPYLQVGSGPTSQIPPYIVRISWSAVFRNYALFGILFVVALIVLIFLLMRIRIFQAIKMGETA